MFIQKITKSLSTIPKQSVRRLFTSGFQQMGAVKRGVDTRNYSQLQDTIDYYADKIPEVKYFAKEINNVFIQGCSSCCRGEV